MSLAALLLVAFAALWALPLGAQTTGVAEAPGQSAPGAPGQPQGAAVFAGGVDLEWDDVPGAVSYDVQTYRGGRWVDLPGDGVGIAFYGAGAIVSGLDPQASLWFWVRATNAHGTSDWSPMLYMGSTSQFKLGRRARPANAPAVGAPAIAGSAQSGESLLADISGIEDDNGLDRVRFSYQWTANDGSGDADIAGATGPAYVLSDADEAKTVSVRVAFVDRGGYAESLTSPATDTVKSAAKQQSAAVSPADLAPSGLGAASTADGILLEWAAPVADSGSVTGYRVTRTQVGAVGGEDATAEIDTGSTGTGHLDAGATVSGGIYRYQVRALRGTAASDASNEATAFFYGDDADTIRHDAPQTPESPEPEPTVRHTVADERILVTNQGLTGHTTGTIGFEDYDEEAGLIAQKFSTGSNQTGYTLTHVKLRLSDVDTGDAFNVSIAEAVPMLGSFNRKVPLTSVSPTSFLRESPSQLADGEAVFRAPGNGLKVEPNTDYFILVQADEGVVSFDTIHTGDEADTGLADWLIKDGLLIDTDVGLGEHTLFLNDGWGFVPTVLQMSVLGTVAEPRALASGGSALSDNLGVPSSQKRYGVKRYKDTNRSFDIAQKFTTGNSAGGYEFTGVELVVRDVDDGEQLVVHLHEGQGQSTPGEGERLATLESAETGLSGGLNRFLAPVGTVLEPSTEYFLVVQAAAESYNDARTDLYLEATADFAGQARATRDWAFASHLLQEEVYADFLSVFPIEGFGNVSSSSLWRALKRWAGPTRATLKMRFFGYPHETQVEGMTAYGQPGSVVTGWDLHPEAEAYVLQWRKLGQTWQKSVDFGQNSYVEGAGYTLSIGDPVFEDLVRYEIRVTGVDEDGLYEFVPSESVLAASTRPPPDDPGPDLRYFVNTVGPPETGPLKDDMGNVLPTVLPEEVVPFRPDHSFPREGTIVAERDEWAPVGLWGQPGEDRVWVLDLKHFGAHPLDFSEFEDGNIERIHRLGAEFAFDFDHRIDAQFHLWDHGTGTSNNELSVIAGTEDTIWVANGRLGRLDGLRRSYDHEEGGSTNLETGHPYIEEWNADGSYVTRGGFAFTPAWRPDDSQDISLWLNASDRLVPRGIWVYENDDGDVEFLINARVSRLFPNPVPRPSDGIYRLTDSGLTRLEFFDGIGDASGIWSDGTTLWAAMPGRLNAYRLSDGERLPDLELRLRWAGGGPVGDIWSDGDTIWVTYPDDATIDAYRLPGAASTLKAAQPAPLTAHVASAPAAHDGQRAFNVRIAFSDDLVTTAQDMRDHALQVSGATLTDASPVGDRLDLWQLTVEPHGTGPVSITLAPGGSCKSPAELCTADARPLTAGLALQVPGPTAQPAKTPQTQTQTQTHVLPDMADGPPDAPRQPHATAVFIGGVDLEWDDVPGADSYEVQTFRGGRWVDLPGDGMQIAFYGAGAIISGLDPQASLWFQLRAANTHGTSDWSPMFYTGSTSQFQQGRQPKPPNTPATGTPVIVGTAEPGRMLWADTTGIEDDDGLHRVRFHYQWISNDGNGDTDIVGATHITYQPPDDETNTISVRVTFTDRGGNTESLTSSPVTPTPPDETTPPDDPPDETTPSDETTPPDDTPATGQPTITGVAQVGETLTVDISGIADADGLVNAIYTYQWMSGGNDIAGATESSYTLTADDVGRTVKVEVSFTDDAGNREALTSAATDEVGFAVQPQTANSAPTGSPVITGVAQVGETLTADISGIADADGLVNAIYTYQWMTDGTDIAGATKSVYTLTAADVGRAVNVEVSFADDAGNETTLTSVATGQVAAASNSPATGSPTITGTALVGETLTADTSGIADADGLVNAIYTYQWISDGTDIAGATKSSYTLTAADVGQTIKVWVSFTDDAGNAEALTSEATDIVAVPDPPAMPTGLSATVSHDVVTLTWDDPQDDSVTGYVVLRRDREIHPVGTFVTITGDTGTADNIYTDETVKPDRQYVYRIKAVNEHGQVSEQSHWIRGFTPAAPPPGLATSTNETAQQETDATHFVDIDAGWRHACALRANGQVVCWGMHNINNENTPAL